MVIMYGIGVEEGRGAGKGEAELQLGSWGAWEHDLCTTELVSLHPRISLSHVSH